MPSELTPEKTGPDQALRTIVTAIVTGAGLHEAVNKLWLSGHPDHFLHCARCGARAVGAEDGDDEPYCPTCDLDQAGSLRPDSPLALLDHVQELAASSAPAEGRERALREALAEVLDHITIIAGPDARAIMARARTALEVPDA